MSRFRSFQFLAAVILVGGVLMAQTATPPAGGQRRAAAARAGRGGVLVRLNRLLNLTDDQKAQARQIFGAAAQQAQPIHKQLQQDRQALAAAVKSSTDSDIDRLANAIGGEQAQLTSIRAKAAAKFYKILTPGQQAKLADRIGVLLNAGGPAAARQSQPPQ